MKTTPRPYGHLTECERETIIRLRHEGYSNRTIAKRLKRHHSTVSREHQRNRCKDGKYRREKAQLRALSRRHRSPRNRRIDDSLWALVKFFLTRYQWSPEQISGFLWEEERTLISHERIYQYIWKDDRQGGQIYRHLRGSRKQRRKRYRSQDHRGILAGKRSIDERPASVDTRKYFGHWEADTVMGPTGTKHCFLTLVERKTGYLAICKLENKTAEGVTRAIIDYFQRTGHRVKTITVDNGTEFHDYKNVEAVLPIKFYFCHPYHSWERGTNENTNGLIRQYARKGQNLNVFSQADCTRFATIINHRPRKRFRFSSPAKYFAACA